MQEQLNRQGRKGREENTKDMKETLKRILASFAFLASFAVQPFLSFSSAAVSQRTVASTAWVSQGYDEKT